MSQFPLQKPVLCLHVGYGKTGSTAIQSWLLSHRNELKAAGVAYPVPKKGLGDSGNGSLLMEALAQPTEKPWWLEEVQPGFQGLLFSREHLARELSHPGCCERLAICAKSWGFGSIRILLFVRDPRDHCYSLWAQKVKRAGERRSLATFASSYDCISMIKSFLQGSAAAQCHVRILDYGQRTNSLIPSVVDWLSVILPGTANMLEQLSVPLMHQNRINVTPLRSQLRIQRILNHFLFGRKAPLPHKKLSNALMLIFPAQSFLDEKIKSQWKDQGMELRSLQSNFIEFVDACSFFEQE